MKWNAAALGAHKNRHISPVVEIRVGFRRLYPREESQAEFYEEREVKGVMVAIQRKTSQ